VAACAIVPVVLLAPLACAKLPEKAQGAPGGPTAEAVRSSDSIPLQWGRLVSVTGELPAQKLWFQNDAGELRMVSFDYDAMRFDSLALVIHRK
jgi:hypothetical protein